MKEEYLHKLFESKYFGDEFLTTEGKKLKILDFGFLNKNAGPDFSEAIISYNDQVWAGNIEFHINSSDWLKHQHQKDKRYNNVIAHFVLNFDTDIYSGEYKLPTIELNQEKIHSHYSKYEKLANSSRFIPCENQILDISKEKIRAQIESAARARLNRKGDQLITHLNELKGNKKALLFLLIARAMGAKVNQIPFEELLKRIEFSWLAKLNYNQFKIEALLFGLSGLLPEVGVCNYERELIQEFEYQKKLFQLIPMEKLEWKFSSMRPYNFPTIRIAQLAAILSKSNFDFNELINKSNESEWKKILAVEPSKYWRTHFQFMNLTKEKKAIISDVFIKHLFINAIVPYLFTIGRNEDNAIMKNTAIHLLNELPSESNSIIKKWKALGLNLKSSLQSQGLIEMKNEYCNRKKCLFCDVGVELLKK